MSKALVESPSLAQILTAALDQEGRSISASPEQWRVLRALQACRTPALGGHWYRCQRCDREHFVPNSCGNRHCPVCQGPAAANWLAAQQALLLPVPYFHLVFTLPHSLNALIRQNRTELYGLLFRAASQTLLKFGQERFGASIGITAVLHTWGQSLIDHYHLHCIVPGGGWESQKQAWIRSHPKYLFPVRALSVIFRAKYLEGLQQLKQRNKLKFHGALEPLAAAPAFQGLVREAARRPWVVFSKRPFAGPGQVLSYIGRYTHRVALSPRRLRSLDLNAGTVSFEYKDYANRSRRKTMTLALGEFVRRFLLHVLPPRFAKIRHYGLLANRGRQQRLAEVQVTFGIPSSTPTEPTLAIETTATEPRRCPYCREGILVWLRTDPRPKRSSVPICDSS